MLCKYYGKLLCFKLELPVCFSSSASCNLVRLCLFVWCTSADERTLKLFPFVLYSFAGKPESDRYIQLVSVCNCLHCAFCCPAESSQETKRHWRGTWGGAGSKTTSEPRGWVVRPLVLLRCRGEIDDEGTCWLMNDFVNTPANDLALIRSWGGCLMFNLMGFLSALGMGDGHRY